MLLIAPSILSANFARLGEEILDVEQGGADWIHVDVMDGQFVPNITIGPLVVDSIRPLTKLPLDVHLMIQHPEQFIAAFASAGADSITVHTETCSHLHRTLHQIKECGVRAGVALNPATPLQVLDHVWLDLDYVLLMTVNPGFGGQSFIPAMLKKIQTLRRLLDEQDLKHIEIQVDGGIHQETAPLVIEAGARILVAGNAIFTESNRKQAIAALRKTYQGGEL